ncbi:rhombotarget lipoprotein [Massilia terrae]|uniref:Rhombotarget lipoprotein n=1 Tax=Massilia terrae TaxID=1811224 RepID=A0ABT2CWA7_9BURK|nr:rhombotarget lipoprotein [Massilia terrae]MCS0658259.1 rhombotarget lipoprotein [Massilia terrae]
MRLLRPLLLCALLAVLAGCASMFSHHGARQTGSIVDYLYPNASDAPAMQPMVTQLRPPVRVGIAFVPDAGHTDLPEAEKTRLLERVRDAFSQYQYIGHIEIIPSGYLRPRGGFDNLDMVARMFNVEVMALVSYDQIRFDDPNRLAVLYWTIVGAYLVNGDQYDVQTLLDAAVFDVKSRKLLFRAPGTSQVKGSATMANFGERSRAAQLDGYRLAVDQLIPRLQNELVTFKERIKSDPGYQVVNKDGYRGGGAFGWADAAIAIWLLIMARWTLRRAG